MKWYKKFNTVFYKLIFTYFILIVFTILFMGVGSYLYFSSSYNNQIEEVNDRMLSYLKNNLDENVFKKTERIYIELLLPQYKNNDLFALFDESPEGNHYKIYKNYKYLQDVVSVNKNVLNSIDVYYKDNDMVISSQTGMRYLNEKTSNPWIDKTRQVSDGQTWIAPDQDNGIKNVTLIGGYPMSSNGVKKGYLAIKVKAGALSELLSKSSSEAAGQTFIMNENQVIAKSSNNQLDYQLSSLLIEEMFSSPEEESSSIKSINGTKSMINYKTLNSTGWKLVNITPVDQFYKKSDTVKQAVLLIGVIAVIIGIIISHIFTKNMYTPIKSLISRTRKLFSENTDLPQKNTNEYHLIDNLIDNLSVKVEGLENALTDNLPIIKNKLAYDLVNGKIKDKEELRERLNLLEFNIDSKGYFFIALSVNMNQAFMNNISVENSQFILYNLISQINEKFREYSMNVIAVESTEAHRIDVIVSAEAKDLQPLFQIINYLSSYAYSNFMLPISTGMGEWKQDPLLLHESYREAAVKLNYHYYYPEKVIFSDSNLLKRENSDKQINEKTLEEVEKSIKSRDIIKAKDALTAILTEIKEGEYASCYCQRVLYDLVYMLYKYVKSMNYSTRDIFSDHIQEEYERLSNVNELEKWFLSTLESTYNYIEEAEKNKSDEMIETVKQHVLNNLSEDLSLNAVAEVVHLSPRYFSRVFKKNTGENFIDYVTRVRLDAARELIVSSEANIEEISVKVGYNNPAYFTKKFKEVYGLAPSIYRNQYSENGNSSAS